MAEDIDRVRSAAAGGLTVAETEAIVGHKLSSDEKDEFNKTKAIVKLKAKDEKQKLTVQKPKKGSLMVQNCQNLKNAPHLSKRYTKAQIVDVVERANGLTASICAALDCTAQQFYVWLRSHPDVKQLQQECRQGLIDKAEQVLFDNLESNDESTRQRAAEFVLNRLGQQRGWSTSPVLVSVNNDPEKQTTSIQAIFGI